MSCPGRLNLTPSVSPVVFKNLPDKVLAILPDSSVGMVSSKIRGGFSVSQMLNGAEGSHRRHQLFPGSMAHDAVLVLDPSPGENFGHPVVLFYVDVNVTKKRCSHLDGIYLGELQNSNEKIKSIYLKNTTAAEPHHYKSHHFVRAGRKGIDAALLTCLGQFGLTPGFCLSSLLQLTVTFYS